MAKIKLTWRIWLLVVLLIASLFLIINLNAFSGGLLIKDVEKGSSAYSAGITNGEILKEVNGLKINSLEDFQKAISLIDIKEKNIFVLTENGTFDYISSTIDFSLDKNNYISLLFGNSQNSGLLEGMKVISINNIHLENKTFEEIKLEIESRQKIEIKTNKQDTIFLSGKEIGITVSELSKNNLKTGLDLQGGARAMLKPERELTDEEMENTVAILNNRLNAYGLTDVAIRRARDLSGTTYIIIEMAGATSKELNELVAKQGKFEAKIGGNVVFVGGDNDIIHVCRNDASCAMIEKCSSVEGGYLCRFSFAITLSEDAAKKQALFTSTLSENITESGKQYLNESLDLYLDDNLVDSLMIASDLKGQALQEISISGSGSGNTKTEAYTSAQESMKKLQTILLTGSLPFKLEVVKLDTISPSLGKEFIKQILIAGLAIFFGVCLVIYLRYKKMKLFIPITITIFSELILTLAIAVIINWNLDMASIAGILAAIGTGIDDQIVMIDETVKGKKEDSMKEKLKNAFTIILGAYATVVASLLPLWWAGAGLLRGFAVTTLIGITMGVLITRPAFGDVLKIIERSD